MCVSAQSGSPTFLGERLRGAPASRELLRGRSTTGHSRWPSAGSSGQLQLRFSLGNVREIWRQLDCSILLARVSQRQPQPTKSPLENRTALAAICTLLPPGQLICSFPKRTRHLEIQGRSYTQELPTYTRKLDRPTIRS